MSIRDYTDYATAAIAEKGRAALESKYGQVWDTAELQNDFDVTGFAAPYVMVIRKSDNTSGMLEFSHKPRFYFDFS